MLKQDPAKAIGFYTQSLDALGLAADEGINTDQPAASRLAVALLSNRALARLRRGEHAAAAADAEAALEAEPAHARARHRAVLSYLAMGDATSAIAHAAMLPPGDSALRQRAHAAAAHATRLAETPAGVPLLSALDRLNRLLKALRADLAGDDEADLDIAAALQEVAATLSSEHGPPALALLEKEGGYQMLLMLLTASDSACQAAAADVLRAAATVGGVAVLWPPALWSRLLALACSVSAPPAATSAAMQLLAVAAKQDAWVRTELLVNPLAAAAPGDEPGPVPLAAITEMLGDGSRLEWSGMSTIAAAAQLLQLYSADAASARTLLSLPRGCHPITALLQACEAARHMRQLEDGEQASSSAALQETLPATEREALAQLRQKQRAVFDTRLVALRRTLLAAAAGLSAAAAPGGMELAASEAVGRDEAGKACEGPLTPAAVRLVHVLHEQSPRRTAPVLGPDGQPRSYTKRRLAADWKDNPAGDYLALMDLDGKANGVQEECRGIIDAGREEVVQATLLELALCMLASVAASSRAAAALLHRRDVLGLCGQLCDYVTPAVVDAGQRIAAALALGCKAAAEEVLQEPSHLVLLPGLLAHVPALSQAGHAESSHSLHQQQQQQEAHAQLACKALEKLAAAADTCSGDDFALICQTAVAHAFRLQAERPPGDPLTAAARRLLLLCCDRTQRQQGRPAQQPPRGGCWDFIGPAALSRLLREAAGGKVDPPDHSSLKKGFLGSAPAPRHHPTTAAEAAAAAPAPAAPVTAGVAALQAAARARSTQRLSAADSMHAPTELGPEDNKLDEPAETVGNEEADDEEVEELRTVFDSSRTVGAEARQARAAWLALPAASRLHTWTQTSSDVCLSLALPMGTRKGEVAVEVTADSLSIRLAWFGSALAGRLCGRVRPSGAAWCLEDGGSTLSLLLPKADGAWWRSLLQGGEEKGYHELLQDAVNAGGCGAVAGKQKIVAPAPAAVAVPADDAPPTPTPPTHIHTHTPTHPNTHTRRAGRTPRVAR